MQSGEAFKLATTSLRMRRGAEEEAIIMIKFIGEERG